MEVGNDARSEDVRFGRENGEVGLYELVRGGPLVLLFLRHFG